MESKRDKQAERQKSTRIERQTRPSLCKGIEHAWVPAFKYECDKKCAVIFFVTVTLLVHSVMIQ